VLNTEGLRYDNEFVTAQGAGRDRRPVPARPSADRQYTAFKSGHGLNNALARALLATPEPRARRSRPTATCPPRSITGSPLPLPPGIAAAQSRASVVVIVRLLLFLALAAIGGALLLYLVKRDRRYLRFVWQVVKFTICVLALILRDVRGRAPARADAGPML
jgi:hypothetical protein